MGNSIINVVDVNNPGNNRKSVDLLPSVFRTNKNTKFLAGTLDPLIQQPNIDKISGWVGSTGTLTYNSSTDFYIQETLPLRQAYQLQPAVIVSDTNLNIDKAFSYDDLINQLGFDGAFTNNLDRLLRPEFLSYDPHIEWDKFVNFTQYYWIPTGPDPIDIVGAQKATVSSYTVKDDNTKENFIISPDGLTPDETIILYRGTTYNFNINSTHKFFIKTQRTQQGNEYNNNVTNNGVSLGQVSIYVDQTTPDTLYYCTDDSPYPGGVILVLDPIQDTIINVQNEVVGKSSYTSGNGVVLSNGMKIQFLGEVLPASYKDKQFIVEGVGTAIQLIDYSTLTTPEAYSDMLDDNFDGTGFDEYPFDTFESLPLTPEYVTINRSSQDLNPWSRYNRWFHKDVLIATAASTGQPLNLPQNARATRPIIEFKPNIQLFNFGAQSQTNIDLIDTVTTDAFKQAEGQTGYYIDGVLVDAGNLVVFAADTDPDVIGKIYQVQFVNNDGIFRVHFEEYLTVNDLDNVIINSGNTQQGKNWWYTNSTGSGKWTFGQQKTDLNQAPVFDVFDTNGNSFGNTTYYNSDFSGTRMFGYAVGKGTPDPVLGFPLEYTNIADQAYYLFNNYFMDDVFNVIVNEINTIQNVNTGFLRINSLTPEYVTVWTDAAEFNIPETNGVYDVSIGYTNNPLNGNISQFTLSELSAHAQSAAQRNPDVTGKFLGSNNVRDLPNFITYGTRLIVNKNPLAMAGYFVCDLTHDVPAAIRQVGSQYNQFKLRLLTAASNLAHKHTPAEALDICLHNINIINNNNFPYNNTDMLAWGPQNTTRSYPVTDYRFTSYTLPNGVFNLNELGRRAVYIYHTDTSGNITQLTYGIDYTFDPVLADVNISYELTKGDTITVVDYPTSQACYVPMTPTKMGMYPAFEPKMYVDDTYVTPTMVIRGHDGSITVAYGDNRDDVLLEFEKRVYNNLKVKYNTDLLDINSIIPGVSRTTDYTISEVNSILEKEFLQWTNLYRFDYSTNSTVTEDIFTYNFSSAVDTNTGLIMPGGWRAIYKLYYDTDRPHEAPWEMLGFQDMPDWWEEMYGPAPYTNGNLNLWEDLAAGKINGAVNPLYVRPNLLKYIPVDESGNLLDPIAAGMAMRLNPLRTTDPWTFGDMGPVETAWRRSVLYPFAVSIMMSATKPADFYSKLFDTSRMTMNLAGEYVYKDTGTFFSPNNLSIYNDTSSGSPVMATGYMPMVVEIGVQKDSSFITNLKNDLNSLNLQLLYKVGGFVEKDSLEIIIDSVNPSTSNPGVSLNNEDYTIFLNQGNPFTVASISGLVIQRTESGYMLKGYDSGHPYFKIYNPIFSALGRTLNVGGKSAPYVIWTPSSTDIDRPTQTGTAVNPSGNKFYTAGTYVSYNNKWYIVTVSHTAGPAFNASYFQQIPVLPTINGITVNVPTGYESTETIIPYGTTFTDEQSLYNVIVGYGAWLEAQGFIFDDYQGDMQQVLDWNYSAKEFLFWSLQGWAADSLITISPFANTLKFSNPNGVVDNVLNGYYQYSLLRADGTSLRPNKVSTQRIDNTFMIQTLDSLEGLFFAELNVVQKEHNIILNNKSYFNDIIYDIETGYRQGRIKLKGFKTSGWTGGMQSPGFIYDEAEVNNWSQYTDYTAGDVVQYNGIYYGASKNIDGTSTFAFSSWDVLPGKPTPGLLPNFDLKARQFEEFYSVNLDGFDPDQQSLAQHLIGYQPRPYLQNIFSDNVTQYKFYQGFIKEKGTRNSINRLDKASVISLDTSIDYFEEWAFRIGAYGSYSTSQEIEFPLNQQGFLENPQIINFVNTAPYQSTDFIQYVTPGNLVISPSDYNSSPFSTIDFADLDTNKTLPVAGYVRIDDVTATAYNKNSIIDIANNRSLNDGDSIWLGFREDSSWDVYRYTLLSSKIVNAAFLVPGSQLIVTTDSAHNLQAGDLISISQFGTEINGVYAVLSVPDYNSFVISTTLTFLTSPFVPDTGLIYQFASVRHATPNDVSANTALNSAKFGEKIWVDDADGQGHWAVYQKSNVYTSQNIQNIEPGILLPVNQQFGDKIITDETGKYVFVGSPNHRMSGVSNGRVLAYQKDGTGTNQLIKLYSIDYVEAGTDPSTATNMLFGSSLAFDNTENILAIGAPGTNGGRGTVKFVQLDFANNSLILNNAVSSPTPTANGQFGTDIFVNDVGVVYVGEPGTGSVWMSSNFEFAQSNPTFNMFHTTSTGFGTSISGSADGNYLVVGSPNEDAVYVFHGVNNPSTMTTSTIFVKGIPGMTTGINFGYKVTMDQAGQTLFVSAPVAKKVFVYSIGTNGLFTNPPTQIISTPFANQDTLFGVDISIDPASDTLVVSSSGEGRDTLTFDTYQNLLENSTSTYGTPYVKDPTSTQKTSTTFDGKTTAFYGTFAQSGNVYVYNRFGNNFVLGQTVEDSNVEAFDAFGTSVASSNGYIVVGAPGTNNNPQQTGSIFVFDSTATTSWSILRQQVPLVDMSTINRTYTIDTVNDVVQDYLEIIDPIKGLIPGLADQEIKFKAVTDPAVYSVGNSSTVVDTNSNWLDEHLGELWWDLSTVKYVWYEQGDLEFRRNNWNATFPGSTIDVYEWVKSSYLPSQWATLADTVGGLAQGISGQPKYPDNSVLSVKQVYSSLTNSFSNVYYFWVKNKTTLPSTAGRNMSSFDTSNLIADPKGQGTLYASFIDPTALMLTNVKPTLRDSSIDLVVEMDTTKNDINKHTEWVLFREGDVNSAPDIGTTLVQKLLDSYIGRDPLGNPVPDPALPSRMKYGIGFRPRQSMFVDRISALRSLIGYVNSQFINYQVNEEHYDFTRLYAQEQPDDQSAGTYDVVVEDNTAFDAVVNQYWVQAQLSVDLLNGRISNVTISNPGSGYGTFTGLTQDVNGNYITFKGPTVSILGDGQNAEIRTIVDVNGKVIDTVIVNPGTGYNNLIATVRPHAVIITLDSTVNNRWSLNQFNYSTKQFLRIHTQSFNVTQYWKYVDWVSPDYVLHSTIQKTIDYTYQLPIVDVTVGSYVRINNPGDGNYIILQKIFPAQYPGTFNNEYNLVYKQNGTLQFLDNLWSNNNNNYGFDTANWDQTPFSQANDTEMEYIASALLFDLLTGDLAIYNNIVWFKSVKYALAEQKFLDWAFKTSFIYVVNSAGYLNQPATYKLQDTSYYESYINETKPYHTKVRSFQSTYTATELTSAYPTDFDLPSYWNSATNSFETVTFGNPLLLQQPYINWLDNYTYNVSEIIVYDGGSGYRTPPIVNLVNQTGDPGKGATAEAYIALGKVTQVIVTNSGSGYLSAPIVEFVGGGNNAAVPARAVARIQNGNVRSNLIHIKFDRVSGSNEIGDQRTLDTFISDGSTREYQLTWSPETATSTFDVEINGIIVLPGTYSVLFSTAMYNGYTKTYAKLTLGSVPNEGDVITVSYNKNIDLYHAADRIRDYYVPVAGMPGNSATLLMAGLEYPGTVIDTLPLQTSAGWDTVGWASSVWDDYDGETGLYSTYGSDSTTTFTLPFTPSVGEKITTYITTTTNNKITTVRIDDPHYGTTASKNVYATTSTFIGNGITRTINIGTLTNAATIIDFRLSSSDGTVVPTDYDVDSIIDSGGWNTSFDAITGINLDGDGLVTPNNSYGPEENLPGTVSDTLGISVYTRSPSEIPLVTTKKYVVDGTTEFNLGTVPANTASVQVMYNNDLLTYGLDYNIDYANQVINLLTSTSTSTIYYYDTGISKPSYETTTNIPFQTQTAQGPIDLGFSWNMYGTEYTSVEIGVNGYITFGGAENVYSPYELGSLFYPAIYPQYTNLFVGSETYGAGASGQPLSTGEVPGYFYSTGEVNDFKYWTLRFQGTHYTTRNKTPTVPAYDFEVSLYTNGVDQYVEMIYGVVVPSTLQGINSSDRGAVYGIANNGTPTNPGARVGPTTVTNYSSHVYYSKANDGNWSYLGTGSFNSNKIRYQSNKLISPSNTIDLLSITTVGVSGQNMLDSAAIVVSSNLVSNKLFVFNASYSDVKSWYVTVNGNKVDTPVFSVVSDSSEASNRVALEFASALQNGDVLQAWFFNAPYKAFNEAVDQYINNVGLTDNNFVLTNPPGATAPFHDQAIVSFNGLQLLPPDTIYYIANAGQTKFSILAGVDYESGSIGADQLEVYVNGKLSTYTYIQVEDTVEIPTVNKGDAVAIVIMVDNQYEINSSGVLILSSNVTRTGNDTIRVTTYNNDNGLSLRRERFTGLVNNRYVLSRTIISSEYLWVEIDGKPIASETGFQLDQDAQTVILNSNLRVNSSNNVVISSIGGNYTYGGIIGYRIFYDNNGLTSYKRLSSANSTQLVDDIYPTDTTITVLDASTLTPPNLDQRIPGVVLIDGERIEFYTLDVANNKLGQLKRGSRGTGIKLVHPSGTTVIDQGSNQTIRIKDNIGINTIQPTTSSQLVSNIVLTSTTSTTFQLPLTVVTSTEYYNTFTYTAIVASGNGIDYNISPTGSVMYQTVQAFTTDLPPLSYINLPEQDIGWLGISEVSVGGVKGDNTSWFRDLQNSVNTETSGTTYLYFFDGVNNVGNFVVTEVYDGSTTEFQSKYNIPLFAASAVTDSATGNTSTVWYLKVQPASIDIGIFTASTNISLTWNHTVPNTLGETPYFVTSATIIPNGLTATVFLTTSTVVNSTGTIFELTGIDFTSSANDLSREASVYYQGTLLKNSLSTITNHSANIAYDSGEVNSIGLVSDPVVPDEYRITQFQNRYFLELFIPIALNSQIRVVKNSTTVWWDLNSDQSLINQNTEQIRFLRSAPAALPDKYQYGQNTDSIPVLVTEDGDTLQTEGGDLLLDE